jgi:hypothetical protein
MPSRAALGSALCGRGWLVTSPASSSASSCVTPARHTTGLSRVDDRRGQHHVLVGVSSTLDAENDGNRSRSPATAASATCRSISPGALTCVTDWSESQLERLGRVGRRHGVPVEIRWQKRDDGLPAAGVAEMIGRMTVAAGRFRARDR